MIRNAANEPPVTPDEAEVTLTGAQPDRDDVDFGYVCPGADPPVDPDCSECDGKVTELTLRYNGSSAGFVVVSQKREGVVFTGMVGAGSEFSFSGIDKKDTLGTEIRISVDGKLNTEIHTSCSVPIGPGLVSGDFEVVEGASRNGGPLCPL